MTKILDGDRDLLGQYIRHMGDLVSLTDFQLILMDELPPEGCSGQAVPIRGRRVGGIKIQLGWMDESETDFRQTVVHELLHFHFEAITQPIDDIEDVLGKMIHAPLANAVDVAVETCIDTVAHGWAQHLPLPSEWLEQETAPIN